MHTTSPRATARSMSLRTAVLPRSSETPDAAMTGSAAAGAWATGRGCHECGRSFPGIARSTEDQLADVDWRLHHIILAHDIDPPSELGLAYVRLYVADRHFLHQRRRQVDVFRDMRPRPIGVA